MRDKYNVIVESMESSNEDCSSTPDIPTAFSIFHIENDLDCKVLKYGKEICTAIADEDTVIYLLKGRHKLSFVSLENSQDYYNIVYEVRENGIEDFIDVHLIPIRDERLEKERHEYEREQQRLAILEQQHREEEERQRIYLERKRKEEEERIEKERLEREKEAYHQIQKARAEEIKRGVKNKVNCALHSHAEMNSVDDYEYNGSRWVKDSNGIFYLDRNGNRMTDSIYKSVSRFSEGLSRVHVGNGFGFGYVDEYGNTIIKRQYPIAGHFHQGYAFVYSWEHNQHGLIDCNNNFTAIYTNARPLSLHSTPGLRGFGLTPRLVGLYLIVEQSSENEVKLTAINLTTREEIYNLVCYVSRRGRIYYPFDDDLRGYICTNECAYEWGRELAVRAIQNDFGSGSYFIENGICIFRYSNCGFINTYGFYIQERVMYLRETDSIISGDNIIDEDGNIIGKYIPEPKETPVEENNKPSSRFVFDASLWNIELMMAKSRRYYLRLNGETIKEFKSLTLEEAYNKCKHLSKTPRRDPYKGTIVAYTSIEIVDESNDEVLCKYK